MDRETRYQALQQERAQLVSRGDELAALESASEEQLAELDAILDTEIPALDAQLARHEALMEAERRAPSPTGTSPISVSPGVERDPMRGFADAADFGLAVRAACRKASPVIDPRLAALQGEERSIRAAPTGYHQEGHSAEGYEVPPEMRDEIFELIFSGEDLLSLVEVEPTSSNSVEWLRDESTPWGTTGIQAYWGAEGGQLTSSKLDTAGEQLRLHKLHAYVLATDELLSDAPRLRTRLTRGAARAISWKASEAIMRGTGAGQPLGWENAACLVEVAKETSQTADTIVAENITKMYSRLLVTGGDRVVWLANRDTVPQFIDLKIGNEPSWANQNGGMREAPTGQLLGYPLLFTEHCKTVGDAGDIQLVNLSGYYAAMKQGGAKFASSIHLFFDYDIEAFRWTFRLGGQPFLSAAVSPANGSNTKSHFVYLAARA